MIFQGGNIQFQVPQNIDLEDKIVGPLTLTQFLYVLGGGLVDYILFQSLGPNYFALFLIIGVPIALIALALAFFKVQEQPLSHFIMVGLIFLTKPKVRYWKRKTDFQPILTEPPKKAEVVASIPKHRLEKSDLEQLSYSLDTFASSKPQEESKIGQVAGAFEQLLREQPKK